MLTIKVVAYFTIYKEYLDSNNLEDDSEIISVSSLIEFVDNQIEEYELHKIKVKIYEREAQNRRLL